MVADKNPQGESVFRWQGHVFRGKCEALSFCLQRCRLEALGCAVDCPLRRHFRIPPHGDSYQ